MEYIFFSSQRPLLCYILPQLLIFKATQITVILLSPVFDNFTILSWQHGNNGYLNLSIASHNWLTTLISLTWLSCFHGKMKKMHGSQSFNCFTCFCFVNEVEPLPLTSEETLGIKHEIIVYPNSQKTLALFPFCPECICPGW